MIDKSSGIYLPRDENESLGYGQLFAALWRRRVYFVSVTLSVFAIASLIISHKKPSYKSFFRVLVEPNYSSNDSSSTSKSSLLTDGTIGIDYATQLQLMQSSSLIQRAVQRLKQDYPSISVDEITKNLSLSQVERDEMPTKIFEGSYVDNDPLKTQAVLNAIKNVYLKYNLEQQLKRLNDGLSFVNKEIPLAQKSLLEAEKSLKNFRIAHGIVEPEPEAGKVSSLLRDLENERASLRAKYAETQTFYQRSQKQVNAPSSESLLDRVRLSQAPRYQQLLNQLQEVEVLLAKQRITYTDSNPIIQDLFQQRERILALIKQESDRVLPNQNLLNAGSSDRLLKSGQLTNSDIERADKLIDAQNTLLGLQARDRSLAQTQEQLSRELKQFPALIAQYSFLKQEVDVKRNTLQQLLEARQSLGIELNRGGYNWQVVESPQLGTRIGSSLTKDLLISSVIALFIGSIVVILIESLDDAIRSSDQMKRHDFPFFLGVIPKCPLPNASGFFSLPRLLSLEAQNSSLILQIINWQPFRDSLDLIYKNLHLRYPGNRLNSIAITSPLEKEGKTTLTLGLALSASRLNQNVLIVDANFRNPTIHELFGLPNDRGLSTVVNSILDTPPIHTRSLWGSTLDIITSGPIPEDPVRLLASEKMWRLIKEWEQIYDIVLIDTTATLGLVDVIQIASHVQGVLLIGQIDRVTKQDFVTALEYLSQFNLLGLVANGVKFTKNFKSLPLSVESSLPSNII